MIQLFLGIYPKRNENMPTQSLMYEYAQQFYS